MQVQVLCRNLRYFFVVNEMKNLTKMNFDRDFGVFCSKMKRNKRKKNSNKQKKNRRENVQDDFFLENQLKEKKPEDDFSLFGTRKFIFLELKKKQLRTGN